MIITIYISNNNNNIYNNRITFMVFWISHTKSKCFHHFNYDRCFYFTCRITYTEAMDMLVSANRRHLFKFEPQVSKIICKRNGKRKKRTRFPYQEWGSNPCVHSHIGT